MIATWITCDLDNQVWLESSFENTRDWGKKNFLLDMDPATAFITLCVFFIVLTLCSLGIYKYCHSTEMIELIQRTPPLEADEWTFISNIIQKVKLQQTGGFCYLITLEKRMGACDALCDLVSFVQFKKREKHPWRFEDNWINFMTIRYY